MKKVFFGFMGMLLAVAGANAAGTITAATVKTVNDEVGVIQSGVTTKTSTLAAEEGTEVSSATIDNTTIGSLAAGSPASPTSTIEGNDANITVLQRHKLSVAGNPNGAGHCNSGDKCGYVTTGNHGNNTTDKIWMKIQL